MSLFGKKRCMVCDDSVDTTDASKILTTSVDVTASSSKYGKRCNNCNEFVHYKCSKIDKQIESGLTIKKGKCPKCGNALLVVVSK